MSGHSGDSEMCHSLDVCVQESECVTQDRWSSARCDRYHYNAHHSMSLCMDVDGCGCVWLYGEADVHQEACSRVGW